MKRHFVIALFSLITMVGFAQKRVVPTPEQIARFSRTTTNVVLTGENMLLDAALRSAVEKNWKITPFIFIDKDEFEKSVGDANRTFLVMVNGTFKKDKELNGYLFLNVLMGGSLEMEDLADFMLLPINCKGQDDDKSMVFMDAFVDVVQQHIQRVKADPKLIRRGLDDYNAGMNKLYSRFVLMTAEDLAVAMDAADLKKQTNGHISLVKAEEVEKAMEIAATDKVAALTLYPIGEQVSGTYCYNMLIACDTHELLYFKRHKVTDASRQGFLPDEIKLIGRIFLK